MICPIRGGGIHEFQARLRSSSVLFGAALILAVSVTGVEAGTIIASAGQRGSACAGAATVAGQTGPAKASTA